MSKKDITIQNKQKTYADNKVSGVFQVMNLILLTLLCAVVAFSYKDRLAVIGIYDAMQPLFQLVNLGIPFFDSIAEESGSSKFILALIAEIYLILSLIFLNIYVATRNTFQEQPKGNYFKSFQGLYDFLEEKIYGRFEISISLELKRCGVANL